MSLMLNTGAMQYRTDAQSAWQPLVLMANVDLISLASSYSDSATYEVGEYVRRDSKVYRCITAVTTAGPWDSTKWLEVNIGDELESIKGAVVYPTGDDTDRRSEIAAKLSKYGYCVFEEGVFKISAPIRLLEGQTIRGQGRMSIIERTPNSSTYGLFYIQDNANHITVKDLQFRGSLTSKPSTNPSSLEYGISVAGDGSSVVVDNCYFKGFSSYGIITTAGYSCGVSAGVMISNCTFRYCGDGILFHIHGEYSNVTNCVFSQNHYGVVVTGGNNKFANCGFDSNDVGFLLYDDPVTGTNDGHGSCVSSSFNHNATAAITISNINFGYSFVGCNIYYGDVIISNSNGILFSNCDGLGHKTDSDHTDFVVNNCPGYISVDHMTTIYTLTCTVTNSPYFIKTNCRTHSGTISADIGPLNALPKTYLSNSYVSQANWMDQFYLFGKYIFILINMNITTSPGSSFKTIGSVALPRDLYGPYSATLASQSNASTLLWTIQQNGTIQIYSSGSATGFYRGFIFGVLS